MDAGIGEWEDGGWGGWGDIDGYGDDDAVEGWSATRLTATTLTKSFMASVDTEVIRARGRRAVEWVSHDHRTVFLGGGAWVKFLKVFLFNFLN